MLAAVSSNAYYS